MGDDYDVAYESNVEVGIVKVVLTGKGHYTGTAECSFTINAVDVLKVAVKVCDQTWAVRRFTPAVAETLDDEILVGGTD